MDAAALVENQALTANPHKDYAWEQRYINDPKSRIQGTAVRIYVHNGTDQGQAEVDSYLKHIEDQKSKLIAEAPSVQVPGFNQSQVEEIIRAYLAQNNLAVDAKTESVPEQTDKDAEIAELKAKLAALSAGSEPYQGSGS